VGVNEVRALHDTLHNFSIRFDWVDRFKPLVVIWPLPLFCYVMGFVI
jgi:hypothetical protein